jgi:flagellar hook-associated protein 1 FlgK
MEFNYGNGLSVSDTPDGFYRNITGKIATDAQNSGRDQETSQAIFNAVNQEQQSISGVNIDEELANLLKYQTAYSANAKIISTIDRMLDALLSIKQ